MTKPCSVCTAPNRDTIDRRLLNGDSLRDIAEATGISKSALQRHKAEGHLNIALVKAAPPAVIAENKTLQDQLRDLHLRTLTLLGDAEMSKDTRTALMAIREARSNLETLAKVELALLARASNGDNGGITITFDHEDATPPANSLGVIVTKSEDARNFSHGLPDDEIEAQAIKILQRRGYVVGRPGGIFVYPTDARLSDDLLKRLSSIVRDYLGRLDRGEPVDLDRSSLADNVAFLIARATGAAILVPDNERDRPADYLAEIERKLDSVVERRRKAAGAGDSGVIDEAESTSFERVTQNQSFATK